MNVLVCFKAIPDPDRLSGQDWVNSDGMSVDTGHVKRVFNCFDESALEMALTLCTSVKTADAPAALTALTIDDSGGDLFLRHLLAAGYDTGVRIHADMDLRFDPMAVSRLISGYVRNVGGQQLVLFGARGGEGDNGQTGFLVAEQLGWPCIREVVKIRSDANFSKVEVKSRVTQGLLVQTVSLPVVLVIGNSPESPFLRVPTLKQKLESKKKTIRVIRCDDPGIACCNTAAGDRKLTGLSFENSKKICAMINGSSAKEKARHLYEHYLKKVLDR
jgi:electron transfer flavoprotein alpha/beta subunit